MGCEGMVEKSPEVIRGYVDEMDRPGVASILCGACEARCPFRVSIRQNMKRAAEVFGC